MKVDISFFFADYPGTGLLIGEQDATQDLTQFPLSKETLRLHTAFNQIDEKSVRLKVMQLVEVIAAAQTGQKTVPKRRRN